MPNTYITVQGDTWDSIAFLHYGNENYADILMDANPEKIEWFIFEPGIEITVPDIVKIEAERLSLSFPEWRKAETVEESIYE